MRSAFLGSQVCLSCLSSRLLQLLTILSNHLLFEKQAAAKPKKQTNYETEKRPITKDKLEKTDKVKKTAKFNMNLLMPSWPWTDTIRAVRRKEMRHTPHDVFYADVLGSVTYCSQQALPPD
jgi:hypothetical protein